MNIQVASQGAEEGSNKRAKTHEAEMIPGLTPRIFGFPNSIITTLKYCDTYTLTSTAGSLAYQVMAANGIYDPDITGIGHQPMYRDVYASVYDQYTVIGSKITVSFNHTTSTGSVICGVRGDDDQTGTTTLSTAMESNNTSWCQLGQNGSGKDTCVLYSTFEPLMAFGVAAKDDGYSQTPIGANPSEQFCYHIFAANSNAGTSTVNIAVQIEYTVKFAELQSPAQNLSLIHI